MNIINSVTARIEEYRTQTASPCKNYASEANAEKATAAVAATAGKHFDPTGTSARYVVFYIAAWGRWVGAVDMTELLHRPNVGGGYIGVCGNVFTY